MNVQLLDYELPAELVAQHPPDRRDEARLLVCDRVTGDVRHRSVADLPDEAGSRLVVVNDTRVVPARLAVRRASGGAIEVLLVERVADDTWEALAGVVFSPANGELFHAARGHGAWLDSTRLAVNDETLGRGLEPGDVVRRAIAGIGELRSPVGARPEAGR